MGGSGGVTRARFIEPVVCSVYTLRLSNGGRSTVAMRFRRSKKLFPGVSVNLSKGGVSLSLGGRGLRHTIGTSGSQTTAGIPGTGLSYTERTRKKSKKRGDEAAPELTQQSGDEASWGHSLIGLAVLIAIGFLIYAVVT